MFEIVLPYEKSMTVAIVLLAIAIGLILYLFAKKKVKNGRIGKDDKI